MVTAEPAFAPLAEPTGIYVGASAGLSPGGAFVWLRRAATGRPQILVNVGRGGTRTDEWLAGSTWLANAISQANWAIAESGGTLKGIIWLMGVNNAIAEIDTYAADTAYVESQFRANITGAAEVPFCITKLQPTTVPQTNQTSWDARRAEQDGYTGTDRYLAEIPDGTMTSDGLHPQSAMNQAIAENVLDVLAPVVP